MKYCDEYEKLYVKNNFVIDMTWKQFFENNHYQDIIQYLNCLNDPNNPWNNVNYTHLSKYKGMQKPYTEKDIDKLITQYDFTFEETIYMFLTKISRTYIDNSFRPIFDFVNLRTLHKKGGLLSLIENKDKIFVLKINDHISIEIDTYFTNIEYFMVNLHNDEDDNILDVKNLYIYLGKTLELNNFVLKNGTIWTKLEDIDEYIDEDINKKKRCVECNDENFTENYEDYHNHNYIRYELIVPSILDLCVITHYYRYHSVCRWNG